MFFLQDSTSKRLLSIFCIFAFTSIVSFLSVMKGIVNFSRRPRDLNITDDEVLIDKPFAKLFAYYMLTAKCIPPYYLESLALGNSSRCDVYVNSYKEKCEDENIPKHITHIFQKTTWSVGRNLLFYHVKGTGKRYSYHIFLDDDAIPIHTDHFSQFRKVNTNPNFLSAYVNSKNGLQEGIYWKKDDRSAWRLFEDDLLSHSPAFAITNFVNINIETRLLKQKHFKEVCGKDREMPWMVPTFYLDEIFIAFHEEALPMMLPYTTMFEEKTWVASGILHIFRAKALLYRKGMVNYKVAVVNHMHRPYPRASVPKNLLAQYLAGDGKDLKGIIDETNTTWNYYNSWEKWQEAFMHTTAICTVPLKFPEWKHYKLG